MVNSFEKEQPKYVSKEDCLIFKLNSTPNYTNSITYKIKLYAFDSRSSEEWLKYMKTFKKILKGQNITNGEPVFAMLKPLLRTKH